MTTARRVWGSLCLFAAVALLLAAGCAWYFGPSRYEAFALLRVAARPPAVLSDRPFAPTSFPSSNAPRCSSS